MIHRVLFQPKPITFLYINSEVLSIIFFHCDMNALTLKVDMGISVKIMKSHRKTFTFGYSLWIFGFAPLKIMKLSDERQKFFFNILKHFMHKKYYALLCIYVHIEFKGMLFKLISLIYSITERNS